jgi:hypothetical protein
MTPENEQRPLRRFVSHLVSSFLVKAAQRAALKLSTRTDAFSSSPPELNPQDTPGGLRESSIPAIDTIQM